MTGKVLQARGATVAVAESATAGMFGARLTSVAGSSSYFKGGFLTYSDEMKTVLLGVPAALIAGHSAVSEAVALSMAENARAKTGATYGISITGEAGPESATANPVGMFFVAVADANGAEARRFQFPGDRTRLRQFATQWALELLRRRVLGI